MGGGGGKFRINEPSMAAAAAVLIIKLTLKVTFGAQVADGQSQDGKSVQL